MQASVDHDFKDNQAVQKRINRAYEFADLSDYSFKDRILIRAADLVFYTLINLIGISSRFEVIGMENHAGIERNGNLPIYTVWHDSIFMMTYFWRKRGIVVMTSQSFDGEYIARFIQRFGYGVARGSSTRGGVGALVELTRLMRAGCAAGFMIDGPKGPRHIAKMGAVMLAKKTGQPILPMSLAVSKFWQLPSWDLVQIPKPFTRTRIFVGDTICVATDADEQTLKEKRNELQQALDSLTQQGKDWRASL